MASRNAQGPPSGHSSTQQSSAGGHQRKKTDDTAAPSRRAQLKQQLRGLPFEAAEALLAGGADSGQQALAPLPGDLRAAAERSLGQSLDHVAVDDSPEAQAAAQSAGATALTAGSRILLGPDFPGVDTAEGRKILAHELGHVAQQGGRQDDGGGAPEGRSLVGAAAEAEADSIGGAILDGRQAGEVRQRVGSGEAAAWASSEHEAMGTMAAALGSKPTGGGLGPEKGVLGANNDLTFGQGSKLSGDWVESRFDLEQVDNDLQSSPESLGEKVTGFLGKKITEVTVGSQNVNHFFPLAAEEWRTQHEAALSAARLVPALKAEGRSEAAADFERSAIHAEAFASHFLQDSFAAGHQYPRANDAMSGHVWREGVAQAKPFHDAFNELPEGLPLRSSAGQMRMHGDNTGSIVDITRVASVNAQSVAQVLAALQGPEAEAVAPKTEGVAAQIPTPDVAAILQDKDAAPLWIDMTSAVHADMATQGEQDHTLLTQAGTPYERNATVAQIRSITRFGNEGLGPAIDAFQNDGSVATALAVQSAALDLLQSSDESEIQIREALGSNLLVSLADNANEYIQEVRDQQATTKGDILGLVWDVKDKFEVYGFFTDCEKAAAKLADQPPPQTAPPTGSPTHSGTVTAEALNIRGGPSTGHAKLGLLKQGDAVKILGSEGDWLKIRHGESEAWVHGGFVDVGATTAQNKASTEAAGVPPQGTSRGVTRAEFIKRVRPASTVLMSNPDDVMDWAHSQGIVGASGAEARANAPVTRSEAAQIICNIEGWSAEPEPERVAWFGDVLREDWFFVAAHQARLHGVFVGTRQNTFCGATPLSATEAKTVIERYGSGSPGTLTRDQQSAHLDEGVTPPDEAIDTRGLLDGGELSADQIARVRDLAATLPQPARKEVYRRLATMTGYHNQRNNASKYAPDGDYMCNVTSLAMVFEGLGVANPDGSRQYEDYLDEMHQEQGLAGSRYSESGHNAMASAMGIKGERKSFEESRTAGATKKWFQETVLPRLEDGAQATMSILAYGEGHIVRLQWVEADGVVVDDPFGKVKVDAKQKFQGYHLNSDSAESGEETLGADNKWPWEFLCREIRYVHFFTR